MEIRAATNADRSGIEELIFPILSSFGLSPDPESTDADLADLDLHYFSRQGRFDLLVGDNDEIVGTVAIHRTTPELCELRKMYLSPTVRGSGWGQRLLDHALSEARQLGYKRIWLESAHCLETAVFLYRRNGFEDFDAPHLSSRCELALARAL